MKVLIVDDDEITLELLDHALMTAGHETAVAHNGKVGLKAFREFNPDLVLTDIEMPEMNGLELLTKIRTTTCANPSKPKNSSPSLKSTRRRFKINS